MAIRTILYITALVLTGCHQYAPVSVTAIDASTGGPVSGISVVPDIPHILDPFHPRSKAVVTDASGTAVIWVCVNYMDQEPQVFLDTTEYLIDDARPSVTHRLSRPAIQTSQLSPYPVEIRVLTIAAYRAKYP